MFNVISTSEIVAGHEESKHNYNLSLPCVRLVTTKIEKPKNYTKDWRTINMQTDLRSG